MYHLAAVAAAANFPHSHPSPTLTPTPTPNLTPTPIPQSHFPLPFPPPVPLTAHRPPRIPTIPPPPRPESCGIAPPSSSPHIPQVLFLPQFSDAPSTPGFPRQESSGFGSSGFGSSTFGSSGFGSPGSSLGPHSGSSTPHQKGQVHQWCTTLGAAVDVVARRGTPWARARAGASSGRCRLCLGCVTVCSEGEEEGGAGGKGDGQGTPGRRAHPSQGVVVAARQWASRRGRGRGTGAGYRRPGPA